MKELEILSDLEMFLLFHYSPYRPLIAHFLYYFLFFFPFLLSNLPAKPQSRYPKTHAMLVGVLVWFYVDCDTYETKAEAVSVLYVLVELKENKNKNGKARNKSSE